MTQSNDNELRILSGTDCGDLLEDLRAVLHEAGLVLEEMDLWEDLRDIRWLATLSGPVLDVNRLADADGVRRVRGFQDAVFIKRSIRALQLSREVDGWANPAGRLRHWRIRKVVGNDETLSVRQAQQSLDFLYEVEVAARLKFTFSKMRFAEPDLYIESPEAPISWTVACKRPRSINSVAGASRKAVDQITKQGRLGIVMISLDNLLDRVVIDPSGNSLESTCHARMDACIKTFSGDVLARVRRHPPTPATLQDPESGNGVLGVLTTASFLLLGRDGSKGEVFLNTRMEPSMINRNEPDWAKKATWFVLNTLKGADELLKTRY